MFWKNTFRSPKNTVRKKRHFIISRYTLTAGKRTVPVRSCLQLSLLLLCVLGLLLTFKVQGKIEKHSRVIKFKSHGTVFSFIFPGKPSDAAYNNGTSLIAACQNGHEMLRKSMQSWMKVEGINEIIVVDWSSSPPLQFVVEELDRTASMKEFKKLPPVTVLTVGNSYPWIASSAYNTAIRVANYGQILRVDCDHSLNQQFIEKHPLFSKRYFAGSKNLTRSEDEQHLERVLYVRKEALQRIGGYDERLQQYGGEHEDLLRRLGRLSITRMNIDYDSVRHNGKDLSTDDVWDSSEFRRDIETDFASDIVDIEREVNLRIISSMPVWNASFLPHGEGVRVPNITIPSFRHANVRYVSFNLTHETPSVREIISKASVVQKREAVISKMLWTRHQVPWCLSELLEVDSRLEMLRTFSLSEKQGTRSKQPGAIFLHTFGSLTSRLTALTSSMSFAQQTSRLLFVLWPRIFPEDNSTSYFSLFKPHPELVVLEHLKDPVLSTTFCTPSGPKASTYFYSVSKSDPSGTDVIRNDAAKHISIKADTQIVTDELRYSNSRASRKQFLQLTASDKIEEHVRGLHGHLAKAIGIFIPEPENGDAEVPSSQSLKLLTDVYHRLDVSSGRGNATHTYVYMDANELFRDRLSNLDVELVPPLRITEGCVTNRSSCFQQQLGRVIALMRTAEFYSPLDDEVSQFIRLMRDE